MAGRSGVGVGDGGDGNGGGGVDILSKTRFSIPSSTVPSTPWSLSDYRMITLCLCQGGSTIAIHCSDAKKRILNI